MFHIHLRIKQPRVCIAPQFQHQFVRHFEWFPFLRYSGDHVAFIRMHIQSHGFKNRSWAGGRTPAPLHTRNKSCIMGDLKTILQDIFSPWNPTAMELPPHGRHPCPGKGNSAWERRVTESESLLPEIFPVSSKLGYMEKEKIFLMCTGTFYTPELSIKPRWGDREAELTGRPLLTGSGLPLRKGDLERREKHQATVPQVGFSPLTPTGWELAGHDTNTQKGWVRS